MKQSVRSADIIKQMQYLLDVAAGNGDFKIDGL